MKKNQIKIGLACAGGGVEGAIYEIGALCALDEVLTGIRFDDLDVYVGVSAGALVASCLANGVNPWEMSRIMLSRKTLIQPIEPSTFFKPALSEYWRKTYQFPGMLAASLRSYIKKPGDISLMGSLANLINSLPVGYFDNEPLRTYLEGLFKENGMTDNYKDLNKVLRIVATDLDNGNAVIFGEEGWDDVPISKSVQASSSLPVMYLPVEIKGRQFVDGVARKTVHASVALDEGVNLLFCINPIVPLDYVQREEVDRMINKSLSQNGLPSVLSQVFRTMIHSRMQIGLKNYETVYPDSDIIVMEPEPNDYKMFFTNIFSFTNRLDVAEHGYQTTRKFLKENLDTIEPKLAKHGVHIRKNVLIEQRTLKNNPRLDLSGSDFVTDNLDHTLDYLDNILGQVG